MTMRDINAAVIELTCKTTGKSYAVSMNPLGLKVEAFITHSWDEPFAEFVASIRTAFQTTLKKPNLWVCAFALPQGIPQGKHVSAEKLLNVPLAESPFIKAIKRADTFVVVRNSSTDLYTRIWCVCELIFARKYGLFPEKTHVTGTDEFSHLQTSCLDAHASFATDKAKILKTLLTEHNHEDIDNFIHQLRTHGAPNSTDTSEKRNQAHQATYRKLETNTSNPTNPIGRVNKSCFKSAMRRVNLIFCYGTLQPDDDSGLPWTEEAVKGMEGQPAHIAKAKLFLDSYPCLVFDNTSTTNVYGWAMQADSQLFEEKLKLWDHINQYKKDGSGLYKRTVRKIVLGDPEKAIGRLIGPCGVHVKAYVYHRPECDKKHPIPSGDWLTRPGRETGNQVRPTSANSEGKTLAHTT